MTKTNEKGIIALIKKAKKRATWYEQNYRFAKDFQKRKTKQFWTVIGKYMKTHELTTAQKQFMDHLVPNEFIIQEGN